MATWAYAANIAVVVLIFKTCVIYTDQKFANKTAEVFEIISGWTHISLLSLMLMQRNSTFFLPSYPTHGSVLCELNFFNVQ